MGSRAELSFTKRGPRPEPSGDFLGESIPRRTFLTRAARFGTGVALGVTGYGYVDTKFGEYYWGDTTPEIGTFDNKETAKKFPNTWTFVIGGYNVDDTDRLASAVTPALSQFSQVAYIKLSNNGLDMDVLKDTVDAFVEEKEAKDFYIYGHSMGGMVGTELGAHLVQQGKRVNAVFQDCSPTDYHDVRDHRRKSANILILSDKAKVRLGPITRFGVEVGTRVQEGRSDYKRIWEDALREISPEGCSNILIQTQVSYMSQFNIMDYKDAFPVATHFIRLRPDNVWNDTTIDNEAAHARMLGSMVNNKVYEVPVLGSAHANPSDYPDAYNDAILQAANISDFYMGKPRRRYLGL